MKPQYWALIILLGAVWGCSFLFNAILIREISPLWVAAGRVTIGAAICWVVFFATRKKLPTDWRLYPQLLVLGILNYAIPFALFPYAELTVASSIVGVINGMTPMTTVIVSPALARRREGDLEQGRRRADRLCRCGRSSPCPRSARAPMRRSLGLLAALAATCCYALTLNYARRFNGKVEPFAVASTSLTGAALVSVPLALLFAGIPVITLPETWAALFGISVFSTSFSFLLVYWLLPRVGATNLSLNTFITPISAILLGVLVLHERFELIHMLGIIVIFFGLVFIDGRLVKGWRKAPA